MCSIVLSNFMLSHPLTAQNVGDLIRLLPNDGWASHSNHAWLSRAVNVVSMPCLFTSFKVAYGISLDPTKRTTRWQKIAVACLLLALVVGGLISFRGDDYHLIKFGSSASTEALLGWIPMACFGYMAGVSLLFFKAALIQNVKQIED